MIVVHFDRQSTVSTDMMMMMVMVMAMKISKSLTDSMIVVQNKLSQNQKKKQKQRLIQTPAQSMKSIRKQAERRIPCSHRAGGVLDA